MTDYIDSDVRGLHTGSPVVMITGNTVGVGEGT